MTTKRLFGPLDYSHIMYQVFGKIDTAEFGLETISASKFCQITLFSLIALKLFPPLPNCAS